MKKFLAIALFIVLVASVLVVASTAANAPIYWEIDSQCYVEAKELIDSNGNAYVTTFKAVKDFPGIDGMLLGVPADTTYGDDLFQAKDGYTIAYYDYEGRKINQDSEHIGTTDRLVVFKDGVTVAEYGLVTYGDADGDGVFDVIDAAIAVLYLNDKVTDEYNPAVLEAVKPVSNDDESINAYDYQQVVNSAVNGNKNTIEISKGRKTPIDQTLDFESVIYANDGKAKAATVTAKNNDFKNLVTIKYNGSATAPSASGIYSVTAEVSNSEKYLVTPGTKELGFMVIAPKSGTGYKITADNANKKIIVGTTDNDTSNATLAAEFEKWLNSAYSLTVGGTKNPATVASALPNRNFDVYSGQTSKLTKTPNGAVLGSYLPDDETLWANNTASNSKSVSVSAGDKSFGFDLVFQQDAETVEEARRAYFLDCAATSRGQRNDTNTTLFLYAKEYDGKYMLRAAVKDSSAKVTTALAGTGLKGVLVGRNDAISIQSSGDSSFSNSKTTSLFDTDGTRYSTLNLSLKSDYSNLSEVSTNAKKVIPVVNSVLGGLGCSISTNVLSLATQKLSSLNIIGKTGYCNYRCSGLNSSIRYNIVFYLEFMNYSTTEDAHYTLTIGENVTIQSPVTSTKYDVYARMSGNEPIKATAPAGYKIVVKDTNGNEIPMSKNGYYLMPYSNATITAVPV